MLNRRQRQQMSPWWTQQPPDWQKPLLHPRPPLPHQYLQVNHVLAFYHPGIVSMPALWVNCPVALCASR